jgi:hypothetical protein
MGRKGKHDMSTSSNWKTASRLTQVGVGKDEGTGAISYPIYPSATYRHPAVGESTGFDYTRSGNPTRQVLEDTLADLEGGINDALSALPRRRSPDRFAGSVRRNLPGAGRSIR